MRVVVTNLSDETVSTNGLPEGGAVRPGTTMEFPTAPYMLRGRDGSGNDVAYDLARQVRSGKIRYEIQLDEYDIGQSGCKKVFLNAAAGDFDYDPTSEDDDTNTRVFLSSPFPNGSRYLGGAIKIEALYDNSDAGFVAGTSTIDVGTDAEGEEELFAAGVDVEEGSGDVGTIAFTGETLYPGMDLSGKSIRVALANSAAGALMGETTAGNVTVEVLYTIV